MADPRTELPAELREIFQNNPLERYNNPRLPKVHHKQLEFHAIKAGPLGIKALIAANRSGKTFCVVADDVIQLIDERLVPKHLKAFKKWNGPVTIWVGAPKYTNHEATIIPLFRKIVPKEALLEGSWGKSFRRQPSPTLTLANGSKVEFKTYDQDLDAWASAEIHRIHWDEEPNGDHGRVLRSEARARLISTNGDEVIGMTPLLGFSWVHDDVWEVRDTDPNVSVVQMRMEDNPWNTREAIEKYAEGLTEEEKRMRLNGEFVSLGGLFFSEFREDKHVVDPVTPEHIKGHEVVIAIDPGRQRTGVTWTSYDKDNFALVFDEYFPKEAVVPDVAAAIRAKNKTWGIKDPTYVIDPSSRNQSMINADAVEAAYAREEIYCQWAQNKRDAGILEIKRRLQQKPEPSLLFSRDCPQTIQQVARYARDPKSQDEWKAVAQNERTRFDLVDTVRYSVMARTYFAPDEEPEKRTAYQPNYQPPYAEEARHMWPKVGPNGAFT
ncbi:MAG TPA: hypothetical protein VFT74_02830 [Isosphaeraceae bacterium]|nr:hypothetical protein [Isosphaeraceae bacterium]